MGNWTEATSVILSPLIVSPHRAARYGRFWLDEELTFPDANAIFRLSGALDGFDMVRPA